MVEWRSGLAREAVRSGQLDSDDVSGTADDSVASDTTSGSPYSRVPDAPTGGTSGGGSSSRSRDRTETVTGSTTVTGLDQRERDLFRGSGPTIQTPVSERSSDALDPDARPPTDTQREELAETTRFDPDEIAGVSPTDDGRTRVTGTADARERIARGDFEAARPASETTTGGPYSRVPDASPAGRDVTLDRFDSDELDFEATGGGVSIEPTDAGIERVTAERIAGVGPGDVERTASGVEVTTPSRSRRDSDRTQTPDTAAQQSEPFSISGDGPIAGIDVPFTDSTVGGALDSSARSFESGVVDPVGDAFRTAGETDILAGPAGAIEGSEARGQLFEDFGRTAAGAANLPALGAMGVRLGDEVSRQVEPAGPGGPLMLTGDTERTQAQLDTTGEVGGEAVQFAQDEPVRTGAFVAGGVAGGLGAGLAGRAAIRGSRRAGSVVRDIELRDDFLMDTRGMADGGRMRTRTRDREITVDEAAGPTDAQRRAREIADEIDDPDVLAREQARILEREQMPPRDVFDDASAFESALDRRVARRLGMDVDELTAPTARTTTRADTRTRTGTAAFAPEATATTAGAFATGATGLGVTFGAPTVGQEDTEASVFAQEATQELGLGATTTQLEEEMGMDTITGTDTTTGTIAGTDTIMGSSTITGTDTTTTTGTITDTSQLFGEPTVTTTETTTRTPRQPPRPRPRPRPTLGIPDTDDEEEMAFGGFFGDETFDTGILDGDEALEDAFGGNGSNGQLF